MNVSDKLGFTPLLIAIQARHVGLMEQALEYDYGARLKDRILPSSDTNMEGLAKQLLECQASWRINHSKYGQTSIHVAAKLGFTEVCSFLIDQGVDLEEEDQEGKHSEQKTNSVTKSKQKNQSRKNTAAKKHSSKITKQKYFA